MGKKAFVASPTSQGLYIWRKYTDTRVGFKYLTETFFLLTPYFSYSLCTEFHRTAYRRKCSILVSTVHLSDVRSPSQNKVQKFILVHLFLQKRIEKGNKN